MKISVEFFPPKTPEGLQNFKQVVTFCAKEIKPDFASLTFGAGGSNANLSLSLQAIACMAKQGLTVAAHLPHAGRTKEETQEILKEFTTAGAQMVVALRGDLPDGALSKGQRFVPSPNGYDRTSDFIRDIRQAHPNMPIWVAGYPEKHPESSDYKDDTKNLKRKMDAGATGILGQFCFNAKQVCKQHGNWTDAGIYAKFRPGVIALVNPQRVFAMAKKCQAKIPKEIQKAFADTTTDPIKEALDILIRQIKELSTCDYNVHVFSLNNMPVMRALAELRQG